MSVQTPLMLAIGRGDYAAAREMVDRGEPINVNDPAGGTPLSWAVMFAPIDFIQFLLSKGADPNSADAFGFRPINATYSYHPRMEVLKLLVENGANVTLLSGNQNPATYVEWTMYKGEIEFLQYFLQKGVSIPPSEEVMFFPNVSPEKCDVIRRFLDIHREWRRSARGVAEFAAAAEEPAMLTRPSNLNLLPPELIGEISSYLHPSGKAPRGNVPSMWEIRKRPNSISV